MSAWSSATGKAQLSYADRLRQAHKSSAPTRQDPSSSRTASHQSTKAGANAASSLNFTGSQADRRLSSASSASAATASGSAPRASSSPSDAKESSASAESASKNASPPVNIWEARRKQIAEREAEKEKERQAALAQQKKASSAATTPASAGSNASGKQSKQTSAAGSSGPRKGNERHPKGPTNPNTSERKTNKQANQSSNRNPNSVPISSSASTTAATSDKPNASATGPRAGNAASTPKSGKADGRVSEEARSAGGKAPQQSSVDAFQSPASVKAESADKTQKFRAEDKARSADSGKSASKQAAKSTGASISAQSATAQVPPSTALSVSTAPAPATLHDDIPASPATVASAIEEVLKNGGANGAQTEDDDAWLARIHLLNGGQNMPKFGGFGPNGVSALSDEAETQAAKKAERAVAAAWGAGKSVWNKTQQQHQQQQTRTAAVSKDISASTSEVSAVKESAPAPTHDDDAPKSKDGAAASAPAPAAASVNGATAEQGEASSSATPKSQKAPTDAKSEKADVDVTPSKKAAGKESRSDVAEQPKAGKATASQPKASASAPSVPPFEDVNNWPSPLDAGKKLAEKPKAPASAGEDKADTTKASQPKPQKSFYETLDELQLRLAPGANPQQSANNAGARKGKQQWVSILPEITHTSTSNAGAKTNRPPVDAKTGKGANRQQPRKDAGKATGQTQAPQGGAKKDGGNKTAAKDKAQAKEGAGDASAGAKGSEARGKGESRTQPASQAEKEGAASKSSATGGLKTSLPATARSTTTESKPSNAVSQNQEAVSSQNRGVAEPSSAATPSAAAAAAPPESTNTAAPTTKQPRAARTHLRPTPNGVTAPSFQPSPNGMRPSKSGASTPATNRSSPRGSIPSSPQVHALPRAADPFSAVPPAGATMFYGGPSGAATPMHPSSISNSQPNSATSWLPYNPYTRPPAPIPQAPYTFDATAPLPQGVLGQLLGQIEFYFSQHNLQGDFFLRQKMDSQGWVDIALVAGFKRVQGITRDLGMVKDALLYSAVLDVDEEAMRVRKRFGWEVWTLATPGPAMMNGVAEVQEQEQSLTVDEKVAESEKPQKGEREEADDEPALGVVAASGFGGALEA